MAKVPNQACILHVYTFCHTSVWEMRSPTCGRPVALMKHCGHLQNWTCPSLCKFAISLKPEHGVALTCLQTIFKCTLGLLSLQNCQSGSESPAAKTTPFCGFCAQTQQNYISSTFYQQKARTRRAITNNCFTSPLMCLDCKLSGRPSLWMSLLWLGKKIHFS